MRFMAHTVMVITSSHTDPNGVFRNENWLICHARLLRRPPMH